MLLMFTAPVQVCSHRYGSQAKTNVNKPSNKIRAETQIRIEPFSAPVRTSPLTSQAATSFCWPQSVSAREDTSHQSMALTFFQLSVPHSDDEGGVLAVVNNPQRQSLDALLGAAQLRQLLLQGRLGEGRHDGLSVSFPCQSDGPRPALKRLSSKPSEEKLAPSSKLKLSRQLADAQRRTASI